MTEYMTLQICLLFIVYFSLKKMINYWKSDEKNSLGINSSLGVVGASIMLSILLYYNIFHLRTSFLFSE